jgi:deazaflavin-dependent oxidoreductase (nitroreductase family)
MVACPVGAQLGGQQPDSTPAGRSAVVMMFMDDLDTLATEPFCYLTTTGRSSGRPHTIEIWFALHSATVYLLSGGGRDSDWVKNLQGEPNVQLRIGTRRFTGRARVIDGPAEEDELARRLVTEKYQPGYAGDLRGWLEASLPVAIDLEHRPTRGVSKVGLSCYVLVLMDQSTEDVAATQPAQVRFTSRFGTRRRHRRRVGQAAVWAPLVVMLDVASQDADKLLAADDQQLVQALPADRPDPALRDRVGVGRPHGRADHLGPGRAPHVVERPGELGVPVADQKPPRSCLIAEDAKQVAGLLGRPKAGGMVGDAGKVYPPACEFDDKQHIHALQEDRVDGEAGRRLRSRRPAGAGTTASSSWRVGAPGQGRGHVALS